MTDDPHRLSPYVRDEATLQRGIEQTALAQTRAAMSSPSAAQVLELLARYLEVHNRWMATQDAPDYDSTADAQAEQGYLNALGLLTELDPAHLRTLAQAQADQQARLRGLVGTWRGHIAWLEDEGDTGERHQAFTECADELEAVLGGKE